MDISVGPLLSPPLPPTPLPPAIAPSCTVLCFGGIYPSFIKCPQHLRDTTRRRLQVGRRKRELSYPAFLGSGPRLFYHFPLLKQDFFFPDLNLCPVYEIETFPLAMCSWGGKQHFPFCTSLDSLIANSAFCVSNYPAHRDGDALILGELKDPGPGEAISWLLPQVQ